MKEDRLFCSRLALMHIHKHDVSLNSEDGIVHDFAAPVWKHEDRAPFW